MAMSNLGNGSVPDGCAAAHVALEKATDAYQASRRAWEANADIARELAGLRGEVREGFAQMRAELRNVRGVARRANDGVEELEDTKVRDLRALLVQANRERVWMRHRLIGALVSIVVVVAGAAILMALGLRR